MGTDSPGTAELPVLVRGTGSIGLRHLRVLRDLVGVPVQAWPVRRERSADLAAAGFPVQGAGPMGGQSFAGVIIATDTGRHLADLMELAPLGPLFVEKPLAPTGAGLREAADRLARVPSKCWVVFPLRFEPAMATVRKLLPGLGRIVSIRAECQSYLPDWRPGTDYRQGYSARRDEGGVLRDLCHELDYLTWLFGPVRSVSAKLTNHGILGIEAEEAADLRWETAEGATVTARLDYLSKLHRRRLLVMAEAGILEWDLRAGSVTVRRADGPTEAHSLAGDRDRLFAEMDGAFLAAAAGGVPDERLVPFDVAAQLVLLTDAARASSEAGSEADVVQWSAVRSR